MELFKKTSINFIGVRQRWYMLSGTLILAGLISIAFKGIEYGIDFKGGTELVVRFNEPVEIGVIRNALGQVGLANSEIKSYGADALLVRTTEQEEGTKTGDKIRAALKQGVAGKSFEVLKEDKIGPKVGEELRRDAGMAVIWALVAILAYVGIRFKFTFGVGAVVALLHDVLVVLGVMSICDGLIPGMNLEITQEVIAALLTLVGVSVNDTVVVFDRIRENLKIHKSLSLSEIMNRSLNETLSRTIITSFTIFLVLIILLLFGGEVNRAFAFAMTIGIITGTYSSIYVASALVLEIDLWRNKKA